MNREEFELDTIGLGPLPVINAFIDRLGLAGLLARFVPHDDRRLKLAPAAAIAVVIRNLVIGHRRVYALEEWAASFDPALLDLGPSKLIPPLRASSWTHSTDRYERRSRQRTDALSCMRSLAA